MKQGFLSSLTVRMVVIVTILHLFISSILYIGLGAVVKDGYQSQFIDYVRSDAFIFASYMNGINDPAGNINSHAIEESVLAGLTVFVQVFDKNKDLVQSAGSVQEGYVFVEDFGFGQGGDDIYHIAVPMYDELGKFLGEIRIAYDESATREQIELAYQRVLWFSLAYIVVAITLITFFGQKLTRPIQTLRELTRKIAQNKYQGKISVDTHVAEIQSLANTIEFMREELVSQMDLMEHQALHDSLTSLPNRVLLKDRVKQVISSRSHADEPFVLALIDLDRFKEINDTFGHHAGDNVLKQSATRIAGLLRKSDTVARLGGDEFALLLTDTKIPDAIAVVERIVQEITRSFECEGHSISLGASVGLAGYPEDGESHEQLLKRADIAMYSAKRSGGGVKAYTPVMDEDYITGLTLISDLRMALEQGQFFAVYQPKIDIRTGELSGVESLIRWMHPQNGLVHPNDFIPLAERSGLISQMTQWVLRESISQVADWMKKGIHIPVAVNLSPKNLIEDGLHETILGFLKEFDVPAKLLELEITENSVIDDPLRATEILGRLHDVGIKIAIDDFGTGNSSLAQLRRMPVSVIKVDQSFVQHMTKNTSDATIVKATINMAHELGLKVVAEGVEDSRTLRQLRELGCDIAQGFLLAKPMPASDLEAWLTNLSDKDGHALTKDMWRKEHSLKQRFAALLRQQT